jgi:class I fructose-bisphosphate aldolase
MDLGKRVRLNRLFAHSSGRLCSVAFDHFIGYNLGLPEGLRDIKGSLAAIISAKPDAVTLHKGLASAVWASYAGIVPLIMQSTITRVDDTACEQIATPEDAVRLGADGFAVAAFVRGQSEAAHLRTVSECVRDAERFGLPVICHIYPRDLRETPRVSLAPEDISWAVRCAVEVGVDVVKTPYCGDVSAYAQIVGQCPVPLVAAGGPKCDTLAEALAMMADVVASGARGATIGRNIWQSGQVGAAVVAFKAVIHDGVSPETALQRAGLA